MERYAALRRQLEDLGLSESEAGAYVALVGSGRLPARLVAEVAGLPRSSIYPTLYSLVDRGLVEGSSGYGARFRAVAPEEALPSLIDLQRETLLERERLAKDLVQQLVPLVAEAPNEESPEVVEVMRNRRVITDRFERLRLEARETIDTLVKPPVMITRRRNVAHSSSLARGVRIRGLYEPQMIESPETRGLIEEWVRAGEEARISTGPVPLKLALFDDDVVLVPLDNPGEAHEVTALVLRHKALLGGLHVLFDSLWEQSEPFIP